MKRINWLLTGGLVVLIGSMIWGQGPAAFVFDGKMIFIVLLTVAILVFPITRSIKQAKERKAGIPLEDERTLLIRLKAGAQAFQYSMILWLIIFALNAMFLDRRQMLGMGILGSTALYGLCFYFQSRKDSV